MARGASATVDALLPPLGARRASATGILKWCPLSVKLLLVALALPSELSFSIGELRLSPYRLVLIGAFVPSAMRLFSGAAGAITMVDVLVLVHVIWSYVVLAYHHGIGVAIESGGIRMLEFAGGYLIARAAIVDERTFRGAMAMLFAVLIVLAPFVLFETITGFPVIKKMASAITGYSLLGYADQRLGLSRAYGPFDHPILMGVFGAGAFAVARLSAVPRMGQPRVVKWPQWGAVVGAFCSLSSGALAALMVQGGLLAWDSRTRQVRSRWLILASIIAVLYVAVDAMSNRSALHVFLSYLTFSSETAYTRLAIFDAGVQDIWRNPVFGLGFSPWTRPEWMHSDTMDNFWLVEAVQFGIPGFLTMALAFLVMLSHGWNELPSRLSRVRLGWAVSVIGMMVAAATVHFWNSQFVYFFFFLGAGAWFLSVRRASHPGGEGDL